MSLYHCNYQTAPPVLRKYMQSIVTDRVVWSVGQSVTEMSHAKTTEPTDLLFGLWTRVDWRKLKFNCYSPGSAIVATWESTVVSRGNYDWTVHLRWRCSFMSNDFDQLSPGSCSTHYTWTCLLISVQLINVMVYCCYHQRNMRHSICSDLHSLSGAFFSRSFMDVRATVSCTQHKQNTCMNSLRMHQFCIHGKLTITLEWQLSDDSKQVSSTSVYMIKQV